LASAIKKNDSVTIAFEQNKKSHVTGVAKYAKAEKENNDANNDDEDDNVVLQMCLKTNLISFDIYGDLCITSPIIIIIIIVICEIAT